MNKVQELCEKLEIQVYKYYDNLNVINEFEESNVEIEEFEDGRVINVYGSNDDDIEFIQDQNDLCYRNMTSLLKQIDSEIFDYIVNGDRFNNNDLIKGGIMRVFIENYTDILVEPTVEILNMLGDYTDV